MKRQHASSRRAPLSWIAAVSAAVAFGLLAAAPPTPHGEASRDDLPAYVPGDLILKFKQDAGPGDKAAVQAQHAAVRLRRFRSGAEHWRLGAGVSVVQAISRLKAHPRIEYAEPNYIVRAELAPTDPRYPELYGLHNTGQTGGTPGADIDAERAWNVSTGSRDVIVGVIDTGIDYPHPDLAANIWTNPGEIAGNFVDDDGNGFVDDVRGWDFVNNDNNPLDDNGHGTHVAGTIGAVANNAVGVAGVAWSVSLVPIKFLNAGGSGTFADAVSAIEYATTLGVDITSNSWGGGGFSQALLDAILESAGAEILFVAAAGNSASNNDLFPHYPSSYDAPNIVAVAATDHRDLRASFSSFGATSVDLGAPGVATLSSLPGGGYGLLSGTSMATPHVSGAAALVRSVVPGVPAVLLRQRLLDTADPLPSLSAITVSGGRLNAFLAIADPDSTPPGPIEDLAVLETTSNTIIVTWSATGDDGEAGTASSYDLRYATSPLDEASFASAAEAPGPVLPLPAGGVESIEILGLAAGTTYHIAVKAKDEWGNPGPISNVASGTTLPPPALATSPPAFDVALYAGRTTTRTLTIENAGEGTLDWRIPAARPAGYRSTDSDSAGGPVFDWEDIAQDGVPIESLDGDDQISDPIPLGFSFPFYSESFDRVRVSTNGWLSFTSTQTSAAGEPLPSATAPDHLIAPFWDDLDFKSEPRAVSRSGGESFTIQFTDVPRRSGPGSYTFQVILERTGEIRFLYLSMAGPLDAATIGIQGQGGGEGLTIASAAPYVRDGLAVSLGPAAPWLTVSTTSGRLREGESQPVTLSLSAVELVGGTYEDTVTVESNDLLRPLVEHPVTLVVTDAPAVTLSPQTLDFGTVSAGFASVLTLSVGNGGTLPLTVSGFTGLASVTVDTEAFTVPAGGSRTVLVWFSPPSAGELESSLTVHNDTPGLETATVDLRGTAVQGPGLQLSPTFFSESLLIGSRATRLLSLTNASPATLTLRLTADRGRVVVDSAAGPAGAPADQEPDGSIPSGYRFPAEDSPSSNPARMPAGDAQPGAPGVDPADEPLAGLGEKQIGAEATLAPNGGFEQGDFTGWTVTQNGRQGTLPWRVSLRGAGAFANTSPLDGAFDAHNGFDGEAGLEYTLTRDLVVPADALGARLTYMDRIQFNSFGIPSTLPRLYEAFIEDLEGNALLTFVHEEVLLNGRTYTDRHWQRREADLSPYAGRTVRLRIREFIPESFTGPASIEFDDFQLEIDPVPEWLSASPQSVTLPPGGTADFAVTFDAASPAAATFLGAIRIEAGLLDLSLPCSLSVIGIPDIQIPSAPPEMFDLEVRIAFSGGGAVTNFNMATARAPFGAGTVELTAQGYFPLPQMTATLSAEELPIGSVGGTGVTCGTLTDTFAIGAPELAALTSDGVVRFRIENTEDVLDLCPTNRHTVRLRYPTSPPPVPRLSFGSFFVGLSRSLPLQIDNVGTRALTISHIASDRPQFTPSVSSLIIPARGSATIGVTFAPTAEGALTGTLGLSSNDPDTPLVTVQLAGTGLAPPMMSIVPPALESTLLAGEMETQTLRIANLGGAPLDFSLITTLHIPGATRIPFAGLEPREPGASNNPPPAAGAAPSEPAFDAAPGDFEPLAASPVPLTCVVEDRDAGLIYAQANFGTAFYRYQSSLDAWEQLANAPLNSGNNGGAALLGGKVYTAYTSGSGSLGVYDIASNSWSTIPNPLGQGTGNIASDASGHLYLTVGTSFVRLDPMTGESEDLASPPFFFEPWGGLKHLEGVLYGHQGNGTRGFASYDVTSERWTLLAPVPSGAVLGAAVDPFEREYVAYGSYGGTNLYRYDIAGRTWTVSTLPFAVSDGGMGWLRAPAAGVYFVQGESGTQFARLLTTEPFITVSPVSGRVSPSSFTDLQVLFDTGSLLAGGYDADIVVSSNDPVRPLVTVPARLTVIGVPDIAVLGRMVTVSSTQAYSTSGASTSHTLAATPPPGVTGSVSLIAEGDYGDSFETATLTAEGRLLGIAGSVGADCQRAEVTRSLSAVELMELTADGLVQAQVENSVSVDAFCLENSHTVRLAYREPGDRLDFGTVFLGLGSVLELIIENRGTDQLEVTPIHADLSEFAPSESSLSIPPRASAQLSVSFTPSGSATFAGTLRIESNDADTPVFNVALVGAGVEPPEVAVEPASIVASLPSGAQEHRTLTISNLGTGAPLDFSLAVRNLQTGSFTIPFGGLWRAEPGQLGNPGAAPFPTAPPADPHELETGFTALPGEFELLSPSPVPLTCVVEDPQAGRLYAQENAGTGFYVYLAALDRWEPLADAPLSSGNNGGAALLNGKIYTAYTGGSAQLAVYDIGTDSWSTIPNPMGEGTGNIASDGAALLYLAAGSRLVRLDPVSGESEEMAPPPFAFQPWGGLRHLDGTLHAHQGNGSRGFASYDIALDGWTHLPQVPGGAVLGAAIDPFQREYMAYGSYGGRNMYRYDITGGAWSVSTLPFSVNDGGMGWLPGPVTGVYFVQGESGTGFARLVTAPTFVSVSPASGTVPPLGSTVVQVLLDAAELLAGDYQADIDVLSNDPARPVVAVPVGLAVSGAPDIVLLGEQVRVSSTQSYFTSGAGTTHTLAVSPRPGVEGGSLQLLAEGDYGDTSEVASVTAEGIALGSAGGVGADCQPAAGSFPLSADRLAALMADGVIQAQVQNSPTVDAFCDANRHTLSLTYRNPADRLEFGDVFVGYGRTLRLRIENRGTDALDVVTGVSGGPGFASSPASLSIAPRASADLDVTFAPGVAGPVTGVLGIASNDPDNPFLTVVLSGSGVVPPVAAVAPTALEVALPPGGSTIRAVTLSNSGGSDLTWALEVESSTAAADPDEPGSERSGGPDAFGYSFRDSDEPGGPAFDWTDISSVGTSIPIGGDDQTSAPIPLGFDFPYYGSAFGSVRVCTNGWLSFTSASASFSNVRLPSPVAPENMLAAFWDDLYIPAFGLIRYHNDGSRFIVQYTGVERLGSGGSLTFQIVLEPDGTILYQYLSMQGILNNATIGMQDATRGIGLDVSHLEGYVHDSLAIAVELPPEWIIPRETSGVVPAGGSAQILLDLDGSELPDGDESANLAIRTNDPLRATIDVPVLLHVGMVTLDRLEVHPNTLNLSSNGNKIRASLQLPPEYDPREVVIPTVSINGQLSANPSPVSYEDENGDGVEELIVKFDRQAFEALFPEGQELVVTVMGEVRDTIWFTGTATIRAIRPRVIGPNGAEYAVAGQVLTLQWEAASWAQPVTYDLILSRDGGETWEPIAGGLLATSFSWTAAGAATDRALLRVFASDDHDVLGYDTSDGVFTIAAALLPPRGVTGFDARLEAGEVVLSWDEPAPDLLHGPAQHYRVLRSSGAQGGFVEIATTAARAHRDPLAPTSGQPVIYYKVIAANAAGEAAD